MTMEYLSDNPVTREEYAQLMRLYIEQMGKTADLQDQVTYLHNRNLGLRRSVDFYYKQVVRK